MKLKIIKILLVNIILFSFIITCFEYFSLKKWLGDRRINKNVLESYYNAVFNPIDADEYFSKLYSKETVPTAFSKKFRQDNNVNSDKKSVIIMGCSFAYGDELSENQTVSYKLSQLTQRPVYNRAGRGWGLSQFLYQLRRNDFYTLHNEPEYIIYIYISDHKSRARKFKIEPLFRDFQPNFKIKNNKLIEVKPNVFHRLFFVENYLFNKSISDEEVYVYFKEGLEEIKKHWQNTKLVILDYPIWDGTDENFENDVMQELVNNGVIVLKAQDFTEQDLTDDKYKVDGWHPSSEAWDLILPGLIKKLNL